MQYNTSDDAPQLYRHSRRPQWGLAIVAWDGRTRRRYQFQDGRLRTFKRGFYHLFEPVEEPLEVAGEIATRLESQLDAARARRQLADASRRPPIPLEAQVSAFRQLYPRGFDDSAYLIDVRGEGAKRALKRHRNPAVELAQRELAPARLERLLSANDFGTVRDAALAVLGRTDLVTTKDKAPLRALGGPALEAYARALGGQLHADHDGAASQVQAVVDVLGSAGKRVTWAAVTTLAALVRPHDHVAVRASVFRRQARWLAPRLKVDPRPSGPAYSSLLSMAYTARRRLELAGLHPQDLLDVYEFIWATLRNKGLELIEALRRPALQIAPERK